MVTWSVHDTGHGSYHVQADDHNLPVYPFAGHDAYKKATIHADRLNQLERSSFPEPHLDQTPSATDYLAKSLTTNFPELEHSTHVAKYVELVAHLLKVDLAKVSFE